MSKFHLRKHIDTGWRLSAMILFAVTPCMPAIAEIESRPVESFVSEALHTNPELKFYEAEIAIARGERRTTASWQNPVLSGELGYRKVEDLSGNKLGDGAAWSVSAAQTFEFPGRVSLRKAIASRQVALAELGLQQFRAALALNTRLLAFKVLAAQERIDAAHTVSKRVHDLMAVLVQREPSGIAPMLETRTIEASAMALDRRASQAERELMQARLELNQLRGVPVQVAVRVLRTPMTLAAAPDMDGLLASGRTRNFDVRTRIAELEQQGFRVKLSENDRWPAITIAPYVAGEQASDHQREFGLGISLPLPLWNRNQGAIEGSKAREAQAEVALTMAIRTMERQLAEALATYEMQLASMARWPKDAAGLFSEAARLADQHYRLGAVPISTYLQLQTQYLDAVDAMLATQLDAMEARQRLDMIAGLPLAPEATISDRQDDAGKYPASPAPARAQALVRRAIPVRK